MEHPTVPANFNASDKWPELDALIDKAHEYARAHGIALSTFATERRELEDLGDMFRERASCRSQISNSFHHSTKYILFSFLDNALEEYPEAWSSPEALAGLLGAVKRAVETKQEEICAGKLPYDPVVYGQEPPITH